MAESFVLLLAAGIMLALAVPKPRDVTLNWLRLGGIIALALIAVASYFIWKREGWRAHSNLRAVIVISIMVLIQLAFVQIGWRVPGVAVGALIFPFVVGTVVQNSADPKTLAGHLPETTLSAMGVAAMTGTALMAMLLGHAYLTASKMTINPFRRLSWFLIGLFIFRAACAVGWVLWLQSRQPIESLWPLHGFLIITRWTVGLLIPFIFILMAHDCIKRRSTQSATGILYVAGVLIFIGELLALNLARETGLPF